MISKDNAGTILVADDTPINLKLMLDHLPVYGFKVLVAQDGSSAIEQATLARPDLILLDVMMPDMDGFEACQRLKRRLATKDIPVIFLTAISEGFNKLKGFEVGAVDYITKPFNFEEVLARVRAQIALSRLQNCLRQKNERLKQEIAERTQLEKALRSTQAHLIQSEKMAALGKLVAGVAHEINTPIGAIRSMNGTLELAVKKLRSNLSSIQFNDDKNKVENVLKIFDMVTDVFATASGRVNRVVRALRSFARLDEAELKRVDIHDGIEETLRVIEHRTKHRIEIVKDYATLPSLVCYAARLNQVFLNLIVNACDAIEKKGEICISTFEKEGSVHVMIRDNGRGIAHEDLARIFDPGFTSKAAGIGTGLGLSICYQIVSEHLGEIMVESEPGKGSTFRVMLPTDLEEQLNRSEMNITS